MVFNVLLVLWVVALTIILWRMRAHYNRLTHGITKHALTEVLEKVLERERELRFVTGKLEKAVETLNRYGAFHMSRIGLVRFNPFSDTGGSQSFTLAILDGKDNGLVMTSLFARTGNRWYVKEIREGKSRGIELSKEEMAAIKRAQTLGGSNA